MVTGCLSNDLVLCSAVDQLDLDSLKRTLQNKKNKQSNQAHIFRDVEHLHFLLYLLG